MPYLPIDFDGREDAEKVAAVIGVHPGVVSWGLQEAWLRAFREHQAKRPDPDLVSELVLLGCLGPAGAHPKCIEAMVEFRFLERVGDKYRLRGAAKWLFGLEGRRRGGLASKGNLVPGGPGRKPSSAETTISSPLGSAETYAETPAETKPVGRTSALTASSQQPAAKESTTTTEAANALAGLRVQAITDGARPERRGVALVFEEPTHPPESWTGRDFFSWFQWLRQEAGFVGEPEPPGLGAWFSESLMALQGDIEALQEAVYVYGRDPYWQERKCPFRGFKSQLHKYAPRRADVGT